MSLNVGFDVTSIDNAFSMDGAGGRGQACAGRGARAESEAALQQIAPADAAPSIVLAASSARAFLTVPLVPTHRTRSSPLCARVPPPPALV